MRKEKNTYFVKIKQKRLEKYYNMCYNYFYNKQIKEYYGKGEKNMTFEAFQSYIKENVLKGWREDADIEMAVVRKNNGIELCGLYIRREEEQISPTIYLDEYYSYYLKHLILFLLYLIFLVLHHIFSKNIVLYTNNILICHF